MIFLVSFGIALLFILVCGRVLRTHPVPFYVGAAWIAAAAAVLTWCGTALPTGFAQCVWPIFARGGLAGALFVIVMWTGAFPNGSAPIKKLMPIRGQLSILASILTLGHNAAYGKVYFVRLFTAPASLPATQLTAAVCSVLMLIIMLPLFVTSFQSVRKKMNPKRWKRLQRWAYVFYGLLCCHILLLTVPSALKGNRAYQLTVFIYGAVFLSYLFCRVSKVLVKKIEMANRLSKMQFGGTLGCIVISGAMALYMGMGISNKVPSAAAPEPVINSVHVSEGSESNAQDAQAEETFDPEQADGYQDGVYTGSAMGMNAEIEVVVTIENGQIMDIEIVSHRDDEEYFVDALSVIDDILSANSTDVDTVTGATYSSGGILDAVAKALESAGV